MKVLMVLTSHDRPGNTGRKTYCRLDEFVAPYYVFKDAGAHITVASPLGGQPPLGPKSDAPDLQTEATSRFKADIRAQNVLAHSVKLASAWALTFDAVFYPGGHGPLWNLAEDADSINFIETLGERLGRNRWHLQQDGRLAASCSDRQEADYWAKPASLEPATHQVLRQLQARAA